MQGGRLESKGCSSKAVQQACACCRVGWSPCILACSISIRAAPLHSWLPAETPAHSLHCCLPTCAPIPSHHLFCKPTHPTARNAAIILATRVVVLVLVYVMESIVVPVCLVLHSLVWHLIAKLLIQVWLLLSQVSASAWMWVCCLFLQSLIWRVLFLYF